MKEAGWQQISLSTRSARETKKRRTRARILESAVALFLEGGIRETRSSAIAKASGVSPATLFNYFPTKQDLAERWVRGELCQLLERLAGETPDRALRSMLRIACRELAGKTFAERARRSEAWHVVGRAPSEGFADAPRLTQRVGLEQAAGRLRADIDARALTVRLHEAFEGGLIEGLARATDPLEMEACIRSHVDLVLDGARKRNERVKPSATHVPARSRPAGS